MRFQILAFCTVVLIVCGCSSASSPNDTGGWIHSLAGSILYENGQPAKNATVSLGDNVVTTDSNGTYFFKKVNLSAERVTIRAAADGYFSTEKVVSKINKVQNIDLILYSRKLIGSFSATVGGEATDIDGTKCSLSPNSVSRLDGSDYSGTVYVYAKTQKINQSEFAFAFPGDMEAQSATGSNVGLKTLGFSNFELEGNSSQKLQVKSGMKAKITMPFSSQEVINPPSEILLWLYRYHQ